MKEKVWYKACRNEMVVVKWQSVIKTVKDANN